MISTLYEKFKGWSATGSVYIMSDPHFADSDTHIMNPKWITPEEQVSRINELVHKSDTLILLGDIGDVSYVSRIKAGYKVLIQGNHDSGATNYMRKLVGGIDNKLFDEVYEGPLFISEKILLSHEPINGLNFCLNIHGHCHNGQMYPDKNHINLAADVCGYTPISLGVLIKQGVLSGIESIHRATIDKATKRVKKC